MTEKNILLKNIKLNKWLVLLIVTIITIVLPLSSLLFFITELLLIALYLFKKQNSFKEIYDLLFVTLIPNLYLVGFIYTLFVKSEISVQNTYILLFFIVSFYTISLLVDLIFFIKRKPPIKIQVANLDDSN